MADLEAVLQDVSYLMAMEKSRSGSKLAVTKKVTLPDASIHCVMDAFVKEERFRTFKFIYSQQIGAYYFSKFCGPDYTELVTLGLVAEYENALNVAKRSQLARKIYDSCVMPDLLANESELSKDSIKRLNDCLMAKQYTDSLFEPVKEAIFARIEKSKFQEFLSSPEYVRFCQWKYLELHQTETINPDDFTIHRIIGRGGFGEVYGCRKDDSGRMFAMKCLDKKRIKTRHGEDLVFNERNILTQVNSAFVVNLHYAFQTSDKLYLIMDLMNGGDLHYHLSTMGVFSEDAVRFYTAELILGLEHLHKLEIVYRDLKPSNILLDEEGHVRISDLGLAQKYSKRMPSSSVGTHGYMAPEVIKKGVQYSSTADWFSLGCVVHKLLLGHSPFRGSHVKKDDIDNVTLTRDVTLSDTCSPEIKKLIHGLLAKDISARLGCQGRGSEELKELPFFKCIDWLEALNRRLVPPMIPNRGQVNAAETFDIGSFNDDDVKGVKLLEEDQKKFQSFNVVVPHKWQSEMLETIFDSVNADKDKAIKKEQPKYTKAGISAYNAQAKDDCVLEGYGHKLMTALISIWQRRYFKLFHGRLEWGDTPYAMGKNNGLVPFDRSILVQEVSTKGSSSIQILPVGTKKDIIVKFDSKIELDIWKEKLKEAAVLSEQLLQKGPKAMRKISTEESVVARPRDLRHTHSVPPTTSVRSQHH